ncbi:MAG: hypothetical protein ACUVSY_19230 [Roseiflexus sp.]
MGDGQRRNGMGQTRPMDRIVRALRARMFQVQQARPQEWATDLLTTVGQACRALAREVVRTPIAWVVARTDEGWSRLNMQAHLALSAVTLDFAKVQILHPISAAVSSGQAEGSPSMSCQSTADSTRTRGR